MMMMAAAARPECTRLSAGGGANSFLTLEVETCSETASGDNSPRLRPPSTDSHSQISAAERREIFILFVTMDKMSH